MNPNAYKKGDWAWILKKLSWKVEKWTSRWLFVGGSLVLITAVLQGILVFLFSLFKVLKGIIDAMRNMISLPLGKKKEIIQVRSDYLGDYL